MTIVVLQSGNKGRNFRLTYILSTNPVASVSGWLTPIFVVGPKASTTAPIMSSLSGKGNIIGLTSENKRERIVKNRMIMHIFKCSFGEAFYFYCKIDKWIFQIAAHQNCFRCTVIDIT